jgi:hypothetical protein
MNNGKCRITRVTGLSLIAGALLLVTGLASSQVPVDENGIPLDTIDTTDNGVANIVTDAQLLSAAELAELVGPVALYPDNLLAIILPASTYPLEIVQAARFLEQREADDSLEPDDAWDESVTALLNYPEVVRMMDEDIDWTWQLGEAVIAQQEELIAAIEDFRDRAYAAGNLKSDERQNVSSNDGVIEIVPVDEEIIYVPYYEPAEVIVYQRRPVYFYYPRAYPVYYYPYPAGYHFASGYFWGVTTAFTIGWHSDYLHVYHPTYWGHPYYGRHYYSHYYRRPSINVYNTWYVNNSPRHSQYRYRDVDYWRPRHRSGSRPRDQLVRNHHYPAQDRDSSRQRHARSSLQPRDNGRMDLGLRARDRDIDGRSRATPNQSSDSANPATRTRRLAANDNRASSRSTDRRALQTREPAAREASRGRPGGDSTRDRSPEASSRGQTGARPDIRFRQRDNDDVERARTTVAVPASGSSAADRQRQRSASREVAPRVQANPGSAASQRVTSQRPAATANRAERRAPAERQVAQRRAQPAAAAARPEAPRATATGQRTTAAKSVQRAAGRSDAAGSRQSRRERGRK